VSIIVFDLDHFKSINDEFGHEIGDRVLIAAGATIEQNLRPYDAAARIGGEEFCVILPRTPAQDAVAVAERLRKSFAAQTVPPLAPGRVTASFGVYCGDARNQTLEDMMAAADQQLYAAKKAGRNTVHWGTANPKDGSVRSRR
jgi:diguanylate cyclase (GGDEF)-like protein